MSNAATIIGLYERHAHDDLEHSWLSRPLRRGRSALVAVRWYDAGTQMGFHAHERSTLCLLLTGDYEERVLGRADPHRAGDLVFYPAGEPHAQEIGQNGARKLIISLDETALESLSEHCALHDAPSNRASASAVIGRTLVSEMRDPDALSCIVVEDCVLELLAVFVRAGERAGVPGRRWLSNVVECLEADLYKPLSMARIAKGVSRHAATVTRQFRAVYGCSPGEYLRTLRLDRATLLIRRGVPLAEVADRTGFADQSHLTRAFRRARGITPGALRRR